ncbi:hypothetical protein [Devosia nitrariae]|nr:hypothetical protein [Devosia nitrariae]
MLQEYHGSADKDRAASGRGWTIVGFAVAGWLLVFAALFAFQIVARVILG